MAERPDPHGRDRRGSPVVDNDFLYSFSLDTEGKAARYRRLLRDLPTGP